MRKTGAGFAVTYDHEQMKRIVDAIRKHEPKDADFFWEAYNAVQGFGVVFSDSELYLIATDHIVLHIAKYAKERGYIDASSI